MSSFYNSDINNLINFKALAIFNGRLCHLGSIHFREETM